MVLLSNSVVNFQRTNQDGTILTTPIGGRLIRISSDELRKVQTAIAGGHWAENVQSGNWAGFAISEALNLPSSTKPDKQRLKTLLSTWIERGALRVEPHTGRARR